jgi:glucan-binding YG repeat protein
MAEDLARQFNQVSDSFDRLRDFNLSLREAFGVEVKVDVSDATPGLSAVARDAYRAQKELAELKKTAEATTKSLEAKFADPMDKFKRAIREIVVAQLYGNLDGNTAINAINAQVQTLIQSAKDAQRQIKELTTVGATQRGSQADIAARFQQAFNPFSEAALRKQQLRLQLEAKRIIRQIQFGQQFKAQGVRFQAGQVPKGQSQPTAGKTAAILEKMRQETARMAAQDRTLLRRIAAATEREANREAIRVRTLSA